MFEQCELEFLPVIFMGVELGLSPYGKSTNEGSLRTRYRGEYFGL
jgi:hypothetical protein